MSQEGVESRVRGWSRRRDQVGGWGRRRVGGDEEAETRIRRRVVEVSTRRERGGETQKARGKRETEELLRPLEDFQLGSANSASVCAGRTPICVGY